MKKRHLRMTINATHRLGSTTARPQAPEPIPMGDYTSLLREAGFNVAAQSRHLMPMGGDLERDLLACLDVHRQGGMPGLMNMFETGENRQVFDGLLTLIVARVVPAEADAVAGAPKESWLLRLARVGRGCAGAETPSLPGAGPIALEDRFRLLVVLLHQLGGLPVDKMPAIAVAAEAGNLLALEALIKIGGAVNCLDERGRSPLSHAAAARQVAAINALVAQGADVNAADILGVRPLHDAIGVGCVTTLRALLDCPGVDVNAPALSGHAPLHLAAWMNNAALIEALLNDPRINPQALNNLGETALKVAADKGALVAFMALATHQKMDINAAFRSAITMRFHAGVVGLLGRAEVDVWAQDARGNTPLHLAVSSGDPLIRQWLIQRGASVTQRNADGLTPLDLSGFFDTDTLPKD